MRVSLFSSRPDASAIPARWKRGRQMAAIASLIWVGLCALALAEKSGPNELDSSWLRARFTLRETFSNLFGKPERDERIVLLEIDDKSTDHWRDEPLIMWGGHLADAIQTLNRSGARLVALDWTQPVETDARFGWNHDERLGRALAATEDAVFVQFVRSDGSFVLPAPSLLYAFPDAALDGGASRLGFADLPGNDGIQTTILPVMAGQKGETSLAFATRIAERLGADWKRAPRRDDGSLLVNFADNTGARGDDSPFERFSLVDLASHKGKIPELQGKIVVLGATYKGNNDLHYVPFFDTLDGGRGWSATRQIAGVELQAHALATLLDAKSPREPGAFLSWILAAGMGVLGVIFFALSSWKRAAFQTALVALLWLGVSFWAFTGVAYALPLVAPLLVLLFGALLMGGFRAFSEERERAQVLKIWGRYQNPVLIRELLENPDLRSGQGREVEVTVLFADLKNFTKTVENLSPPEALVALNRYLALMATTIGEHGGLVDKYLGDGLMAQWGAPTLRADHASAAMAACLEIEKRLQKLSLELQKNGEVTFGARLTLHSGLVVAGPLGAEEKLEYTLIGDTVNVTSRLQETAKSLGCDLLISETTCAGLSEELSQTIRIGRRVSVEIRGREAPLKVFEVLNGESV